MRSFASTLPAHGFAAPFPNPNLDPALFSPSPPMDLQYILSPSILSDEPQQQQQQQQQHQQQQHQQQQSPPHPPLIFQDKHQLVSQPVPSSSRAAHPIQHVHPNPDDSIINFDTNTRSFPKHTKSSTPNVADPYAEDFLRDMLGPDKWDTFSTRLFERRLSSKGKGKGKQGDEEKSGASAIEFLVKVEVVKSILRECVPHPYNPRKSLSHPFPPAPSGHVTLTRSTVLLLCGWSNTQFSYWARRSEAVSVLAEHDPRLGTVRAALERRLDGNPRPAPDDEDDAAAVTGKGLDAIIEDVKKRTGKSQFLRGKHSSLDPFGTPPQDPAAPPPPPQYAMPTFQAERYDHKARRFVAQTPSLSDNPPPVSPPRGPNLRLVPIPQPEPDSREASASTASSSQQPSPSPRATRAATRKAAIAAENNAHHFPVSDSRSEVENPASSAGAKRKADDDDDDASRKRARTARETS